MTERTSIPRSVSEKLLKEFNYRCAICGADRPQIHHIDSNPSNNKPQNLLPLCPNCHLTDQHNPTAPANPRRLALFRWYKDPCILSSEFEPLFRRLSFLDAIADDVDVRELKSNADELVGFISALQMGQFYGKKMYDLLNSPYAGEIGFLYDPSQDKERIPYMEQMYRQQFRDARGAAYDLAMELLRYQKWEHRKAPAGINGS